MTIQPGTDIGRYHILEQLGEGGMAVVYKGYDTHLDNEVAIKVIRTGSLPPDSLPRIQKRFQIEAKKMARMTHPNIVKVMDFGEYEGAPYLIMPYLPGGTLKDRLGGPIPWKEAVELLLPIADALDYAHQKDLVHRDVKPSNILITDTGKLMLSDFGVAKVLESEETLDLTTTGMGVGTPEYMAPEMGMSRDFDHRADIYSLGIVFYELLTGRKPFTADTPLAVLFKHSSDPLPPPSQYVDGIPEEVERVLFKALAKDPEDRFADMDSFAATLEKLAVSAAPTRTHQKERVVPVEKIAHEQQARRTEKRKPFDTRWLIGAMGAVGIGLIIFAGIKLTGSGREEPHPLYEIPTEIITENPTESANATATSKPIAKTPIEVEDEPEGKIVFTCQVDQQIYHDQICIMNADGSGWKQLTNNLRYMHYYASFSPDASKIVFSSSSAGGFEIFIMNSDGSGLRQLTSGMGEFYAPALSPDGRQIVATRSVDDNSYISILTIDGGFIDDLNDYHDCKDPVWSPDGSEILFAADPNWIFIQFYVMNADGSNVRKLTEMEGLRGRSDWSIDGTMASYTGQAEKQNRELFFFGKNKSPQIITDGGDNLAPSFSPDGKWITFMSYRDNFWDPDGCEIYIMRLEDGYTKRLTNNNYCDYQPIWSP